MAAHKMLYSALFISPEEQGKSEVILYETPEDAASEAVVITIFYLSHQKQSND